MASPKRIVSPALSIMVLVLAVSGCSDSVDQQVAHEVSAQQTGLMSR